MLPDYFKQRENFMVRKKVSSSVKVVLSIEDKRKIASFLILLVSVDRRVNNKRASQKKSKQAGQKYDAELGSHTEPLTGLLSGPLLILRTIKKRKPYIAVRLSFLIIQEPL